MKTNIRWIALGLMLAIISQGCSGFGGLLPESADPTATPTPTPIVSGGQGESDSGQPEPDQSDQDDSGDPAIGPDESVSAQCLVGTWRAVHESFSGYMEDAFDTPAGGALDFEFQTGRGDLFMTFGPEGTMSMSGEDFQIDMQIVGLASFTFVLQADGSASYAANGEAVAVWGVDYESSAEGGGEVLSMPEVGAEAELTLTPDSLFLYAQSEGASLTIQDVPDEAGVSPYQCSGDTLIIGPEDFQPVRWERVN